MEQHLIISDIAARTGIEAHVLRYWEKELQLDIPRNELGHRYYLESHVDLFLKIHQLKEAGYQLKAIKNVIEEPSFDTKIVPMPVHEAAVSATVTATEPQTNDKLEQFSQILKGIIQSAISEREDEVFDRVVSGISDKVIKQMDYMFRLQDEIENERFKRLDESIRDCQKRRSLEGRRIFRREKKRQE